MGGRVLIIDDEANIREMIRLTLEVAGYEVAEAEDGLEAFAILGADPAWDVILLDQRLPVMMGTEVLRRIVVLAPKSRVVMMTAFASVELAVEAMRLGATDFLRKPMTPESVRNSVQAAIGNLERTKRVDGTEKKDRDQQHEPNLTLNGFIITSKSDVVDQNQSERVFVVRKPDGSEKEVVVEISDDAFREAREALSETTTSEEFWTKQAQTFLSDFIWNDGDVPAGGRLTLKKADATSETSRKTHNE